VAKEFAGGGGRGEGNFVWGKGARRGLQSITRDGPRKGKPKNVETTREKKKDAGTREKRKNNSGRDSPRGPCLLR